MDNEAYTEKEIELANQIYYATQAVYHETTVRKHKNLEKKLAKIVGEEYPSHTLPPVYYLEIARKLLTDYHKDIEKNLRDAVNSM